MINQIVQEWNETKLIGIQFYRAKHKINKEIQFIKDIWIFSFLFKTALEDVKIYSKGDWNYFIAEMQKYIWI
jgi:hypothetical protein